MEVEVEVESKQGVEEEGPPPGWQTVPSPPPPSSEMAQMVCGSCRSLLSYPRGASHVQCSPCQTVNFVLEAHQIGQVRCDNCQVLLMYPYGAPSVRCSSCHFVTEIEADNRRPPLSIQQEKSLSIQLRNQLSPPNPVH